MILQYNTSTVLSIKARRYPTYRTRTVPETAASTPGLRGLLQRSVGAHSQRTRASDIVVPVTHTKRAENDLNRA